MNDITIPEEDKRLYRLADSKRQEALEALIQADDPFDLSHEIGLLKLLAQEAIEDGDPTLVDKLISTLSRVTRHEHEKAIRDSKLLGKGALVRWTQEIDLLVESVVRDRFQGWELVLKKLKYDLLTLLTETKNTDAEIKELL